MNRRQVLRTLTASTGLVLAGCISEEDASSNGEAQIGAVGLGNLTDRTYSVSVQIERNEDLLHDKTHDVAPEPDDTVIERTWQCEPAKFVIRAKTNADNEPREAVFTERKVFDPEILIEDNGRATITHNSVGGNDC